MRRLQTEAKVFTARAVVRRGTDLHLGSGTRLWAPNAITIGKHVYIGKEVHIEADCTIGDYCLIGNRVAIVGRDDHDYTAVGFPIRYAPWIGSPRFARQYRRDKAEIGDDVWIGFGATVLTGTTIGRGSVIAAGSIVTSDIPEYAVAAGTPARVVGMRFADAETIAQHEAAIRGGRFKLSERGYDYCTIEPTLKKQSLASE